MTPKRAAPRVRRAPATDLATLAATVAALAQTVSTLITEGHTLRREVRAQQRALAVIERGGQAMLALHGRQIALLRDLLVDRGLITADEWVEVVQTVELEAMFARAARVARADHGPALRHPAPRRKSDDVM
jgi:hypothetical protein